MPRIAPYLSFLQKHRHIRIHVAARMKYLNLLDIHHSRLIKANIVYVPPGGSCGNSPFFPTQIRASAITKQKTHKMSNKRDVIVLIKRSKKLWFKNHSYILRMLETRASNLNLTVEVFDENPLPYVDKTVDIF